MRPYVICHMLSSMDGQIDGAALNALEELACPFMKKARSGSIMRRPVPVFHCCSSQVAD
jgi:hypothetical protein